MADITNSFVGGRMDKDLDERLIPEGVYRNALNIDVDTDGGSNVGAARNSLGNTLIASYVDADGMSGYDPDADNPATIGAVANETDGLIYWFVASDTFDGIFEYDKVNDAISRVLVCTKPTPQDTTVLNFDKRHIITGVNYINGFIYWTDNYNPPRRVNIERAKSYAIDDAYIANDLNVILAPPLNSPRIELVEDTTTQANNIEEKYIYFSYRYKYVDGQYSAMSPFSSVAFAPGTYELDAVAGSNKAMINSYNSCNVVFETGSENVNEVQLLMRDVRSSNIYVVESFNKKKLTIQDNSTYEFRFNNNKTYGTLDPAQLGRLFDNVPLKAKAQEFIGNRLAYGNYVQFRDIKDEYENDIQVDLDVRYESTATASGTPIRTWRSDRDYEVGIEYLDDYGRATTVFTSKDNTTYIPPTQSDKGNTLLVGIKSPPPEWATSYRLLVKSSKKDYYNLFPLRFYIEEPYRWFQIHQSDRDKIKEGEYIIIKSLAAGPTYSNKRYKILEVAQKGTGWGTFGGVAGLFFKIKVDNPNEVTTQGMFYHWTPGEGRTDKTGGWTLININNPITGATDSYVDDPVYYGTGASNGITLTSSVFTPDPNSQGDERITVQIDTPTTYSIWKVSIGYNSPQYLVQGGYQITQGGTVQSNFFSATFNQSAYTPGDKWVFNCRAEYLPYYFEKNAVAIVPGENWSETTPETDRAIEAGALIELQIWEDGANPNYSTGGQLSQQFTSPRRFENIEEWWYESGARGLFSYVSAINNQEIRGSQVRFRRGKDWNLVTNPYGLLANQITVGTNAEARNYPVRMMIASSVPPVDGAGSFGLQLAQNAGLGNPESSRFLVNFSILQQDSPTIVETVADDNILEVYHETTQTYDITGGVHKAITTDSPDNIDQTATGQFYTSALVKLNYPSNDNSDFNAWAFGNGLESDRIRDDFNKATLQLSPRVNSYVEDYKQVRSENAICYSGIYGENTSVNKLNEFNLSIANFKYLDKDFGSIQKLHAEDTNLLVLQEDKVSNVLYGKNLLSDSVGGGSIVSIPEVLGTQVPYPGEWGIGLNPESFASWGSSRFFVDPKNGVVLQMDGNQEPFPISSMGMEDYFRDLMINYPNKQKLGCFDPSKNQYVLSANSTSVLDCGDLTLSSEFEKVGSGAATIQKLFTVNTSLSWTISKTDLGYGTAWVTGFSPLGGANGSGTVSASVSLNNTGAVRYVGFTITYCDGLTKTFTLLQGRSKKGRITQIVLHNTKF